MLNTPNPLDFSPAFDSVSAAEFRTRFGIGEHEKLVLFLSRIHEKKGLDLLIKAVALLKRDDIRLCIVGPDDGYQAIAQQLVNTLGLQNNTIWAGPLYDADKFAAYRAANVYVLPTRGVEGLPNTVIESLWAGTPAIVTRTTEIAELIDNVAGMAVDFDATQLATAISDLVDNQALAARYAQNAQQLVKEKFEKDAILDQIEAFYERCRQQ